MSVTVTVVGTTANKITFLCDYDGGAPATIAITNAQLGAAVGPGPFRNFLLRDYTGLNQAQARLVMLGEGTGVALGQQGPNLDAVQHCRCFFRNRSGSGVNPWLVDADTDAVTATRVELNVTTAGIAADQALLDVEYQHTLTR